MEKENRESGLLSLEACIAVTLFIFLMLFMYSFFVVFEARNMMAHVLLSTTNSMALDAFENSKLGGEDTAVSVLRGIYGAATNDESGFTDYRQWYDETTQTDEEGNVYLSAEFSDVLKTRFLSYLGNGSEAEAERILNGYHIKGGSSGLDFSNSRVESDKLYTSVRYTLEYEFKVFDQDGLKLEQTACSKLWK